MKMEVYTIEEIDYIINQLSVIQDTLEVEDPDVLWEMLEDIIDTLVQEKEE